MMVKSIWVAKKYIPAELEDTFFDYDVAQALFDILLFNYSHDCYESEEHGSQLIEIRRDFILENKDFIFNELQNKLKDSNSQGYKLEFEKFIEYLENKEDEYLLIEIY